MAIEIKSAVVGSHQIIELEGRLDSMSAVELGEELNNSIDAGIYYFLLDMKNLEYLSSAGLREMLSALRRLDNEKEKKGTIILTLDPSRGGQPVETIELGGLDQVFKIFDNQLDALTALNNVMKAINSPTNSTSN